MNVTSGHVLEKRKEKYNTEHKVKQKCYMIVNFSTVP